MANRHLSRSVVLQTLFEWDFRSYSLQQVHDALIRNIKESAPVASDVSFMETVLKGTVERVKDLDLVIQKAAPEWPLERIALVDRNVLRLGLYELLFGDRDTVPAKVAINEAIELAKHFGGDNSGRFVNGVLGAVYKELGEPGKDEASKKKKEVPYEELPIEYLVGAVVYAKGVEGLQFALVHDVFGHWTLSKGKLAPEETPEAGVVRKIQEEIGLSITPKERLGENEYVASDPATGKKRKHVIYFLAEATPADITLAKKGGLDDAKWFPLTEVLELNFYEDMLPIVAKAVTVLEKGKKNAKRL